MLITSNCVIRGNTKHVEMLIVLHICSFCMSFDSMDVVEKQVLVQQGNLK